MVEKASRIETPQKNTVYYFYKGSPRIAAVDQAPKSVELGLGSLKAKSEDLIELTLTKCQSGRVMLEIKGSIY